jgi:DNA-binding NtrC family response regulator
MTREYTPGDISIACVDSNERFLMNTVTRLSNKGYDVDGFTSFNSNSENAFHPKAKGYDILLLELEGYSDGSNGLELMEQVKKYHPTGVEMIILTGKPSFNMAMKSLGFGASDYLCHPMHTDKIAAAIDKVYEEILIRKEKS